MLVPAGRPLRAADLGLLAAAGVTALAAHAPPRVGIVSTGDEVVAPGRRALAPGEVRDACGPALAGLVREAGGAPVARGIVPDDAAALERALAAAVAEDDLVVVSAGSSVGARDLTATVAARLGTLVCHGLAIKPGQAHAAGRLRRRAAGRAARQPAVGARRLPARRRAARAHRRRDRAPAARGRRCAPRWRATCPARRAGSTSCRSHCATASRRRASALGAARPDGRAPTAGSACPSPPRACRAGASVDVELYAVSRTPFLSDIPAAEALAAWLAGAGRLDAVDAVDRCADALGRVTGGAGVGAALLARLRRGGDGRHRGAGRRHARGDGDARRGRVAAFTVVDTGDALPEGCDAVVMREQVDWEDGVPERPRRRRALAARAHDRRGRQRRRSCSSPRATGCAPSTSPRPGRPATRA